MPVRTKAQLETIVAQMIDSGGVPRISAADVRSVFQDMLDSLAFLTDVQAGGVTEARVDQLIAAALADAVTGNTETRIAVTYVNGKLNFVAADQSGPGASVATVLAAIMAGTQIDVDRSVDGQITINYEPTATGTHTRYAVWSATGATPSAADFQAGATSMTGTITVPATPGGTASYLHFADIHDQLSNISEAGSAFNSRGLFEPTPVALDIGGTQHYVYNSRFTLNPYNSPQDWVLTP